MPLFRTQMARRAEALVEGAEAFLESRVAKHDGASAPVVVGSFAFTSVQATTEPAPRWQRGLAERLKRPATGRPAAE